MAGDKEDPDWLVPIDEDDNEPRTTRLELPIPEEASSKKPPSSTEKGQEQQQGVRLPSILDVDVIGEVHDDCLEVDASPTDRDTPLVTVIGGGITGMSAAHELIQRGFRVQVVESQRREFPQHFGPRDQTRVGGLAANQYGRVPAAPEDLHPYYYPRSRRRYLDTISEVGTLLPPGPWTDAQISGLLEPPMSPPWLFDILDPGSVQALTEVNNDDLRAAVEALDQHEMEPLGTIYPTPWRLLCDHLDLLEAVEQLQRLWEQIADLGGQIGTQSIDDQMAATLGLMSDLHGQVDGLDVHDPAAVSAAGGHMAQVWNLAIQVRDEVGQIQPDPTQPDLAKLIQAIKDLLRQACEIEVQLVEALQDLLTAIRRTFFAIRKAYRDYLSKLRARYDEECLPITFDELIATATGARQVLVVEVIGRITQTRTLRRDQRRAFDCAQAAAHRLLEFNIAAGNRGIPNLHLHLVIRGQVRPPRPARQRRSLVRPGAHVSFRILERHVAGEHGYRFFPNFYRHLFDIMRSTPILDAGDRETPESAFDQLQSVDLFNVAQKGKPIVTLDRSLPRSYEQARAQWDAFANFGATLSDMTRSGIRVLKYFTSSGLRREQDYENISWWQFMGGPDAYSPQYLKATDQLLRATNSMRPSESDARSFGDSLIQLSLGWAIPDAEKDMTLNGPTSEAWLVPWKRFLMRQGVRFFHSRIVGFDEVDDDHEVCDDQELEPVWGMSYVAGLDLYNPEDRDHVFALLRGALDTVFLDARIPLNPDPADVARVLRRIEPRIKDYPYEELSYMHGVSGARRAIRGRRKRRAVRSLWRWMRRWDQGRAHRRLSLQAFHHDADFYVLATPVQVTAALIREYGDAAMEEARDRWFDDFQDHEDRRTERLPESIRDEYERERWGARLREFEERLHHHEAEVLGIDFLAMYRFDRVGDLAWPTSLAERDRNGRPRAYLTHPYREINGVQYFYETDFTIGKYHVFYLNSPWAISSLSPQRYWRKKFNRENAFLAEVTADIGGFYTPGVVSTSKTAWQSAKFELANEGYAQIVSDLNANFHYTPAQGWQGTPLPNYYHVDHALYYVDNDTCLIRNNMPFLINLPKQWHLRPGLQFGRSDLGARRTVKYEISHLRWVLAGTYMATYTRMTTMESAAESARHAVNAILLRLRQSQDVRQGNEDGGYRGAGRNMGNDCEIYPLEDFEPPELASLRELDEALARRGLPHFLDILGIIEYIDNHNEPFSAAVDGMEFFQNQLADVSEDFYVNEALRQREGKGHQDVIGALLETYKKGVFQPSSELMTPIIDVMRASPFGNFEDVIKRLGEVWKLFRAGGDGHGT